MAYLAEIYVEFFTFNWSHYCFGLFWIRRHNNQVGKIVTFIKFQFLIYDSKFKAKTWTVLVANNYHNINNPIHYYITVYNF